MGNQPSARYNVSDRILTQDDKTGYIRTIERKENNNNIEYWYGVEMDTKVPNGHDGQGNFKCKPGHGAVIPETFIKLKLNSKSRPHSHSYSHNTHNNHNNNNWTQKKKQQIMVKENLRQKVFVNTQELLDQTQQQLNFIKQYLESLVKNNPNATDISNKKQRVKIGLRLYHMNVSSMYEAQSENKNENYGNAFKEAQVLLHKFEEGLSNDKNINNDLKGKLFARLKPLLNYMYVSLQGIDDDKMPELPVIMNYKFDEKIVSRVMSGYVVAANHKIPERRNQIINNSNQYKNEQNQLLQESKHIKTRDTEKINVADITCDIQGTLGYTPSAKQVKQQFVKDKKKYQHKAPDLMNGC